MSDEAEEADVGPLADEAGKLLGALADWARNHRDGAEDGVQGVAEQVVASAHSLNEHLATGSAECAVCPLCRGAHAIRQLSPEVKEHLSAAGVSVARAAAAFMATDAQSQD